MSTKRRKCSRPSRESLVLDLLLEIVARSDITTVVRCAATSRMLRRAILDPAFRRHLATNDGFDPALLLGVSYREHDHLRDVRTQRVVHSPAPTQLRARLDADSSLQAPFKPVASRDGLLVLRRLRDISSDKVELRACDAFTGNVTSLPPTTLPNAFLHHVVVLSVNHAGRSFELLVADRNIRFYQTFSSKDGQWSDTREVHVPLPNKQCDSSSSAVIGRTVYWPSRVSAEHNWDQILALDVDTGETTVMELPPGCFSKTRLLLARVGGRLCLLVAKRSGIAMWTSSVAGTWSRQVVISNLEMTKQVGLDVSTYILEGFGERSGVVILDMFKKGYLLRLDLGRRKENTPVVTWLSTPENVVCVRELFLHEIDLISLLQAMKHF